MIFKDDITRWSTLSEGQFFERKSAFERSGPQPRRRRAADLARDIAETMTAMANADGGELVVGIEDDGRVSGVPHPENRIGMLRRVPGDRNYVQPPLRFQVQEIHSSEGLLLLRFQVDWSSEVHHLADGRYLARQRRQHAFSRRTDCRTQVDQGTGIARALLGAAIEVWMFDDHIEIRSPGLPPNPVTVEGLNQREHLHLSRNPLMVRALVELGYMRELGESIPRMFAEMEREGFYPPRFENIGGAVFQVTLHNELIYDRSTLKWLQQFADLELTGDQKRLLAYAHAHRDRFTSRDYQKLSGLDIHGASSSIKSLIRKGIVRSTQKGSRIYQVVEPMQVLLSVPEELARMLPLLREKGEIANSDVRRILGVARNTASRLLKRWSETALLRRCGTGKGTAYKPGPALMHHLHNAPEKH